MNRPEEPLRLLEDPEAPTVLAEAVRAVRGRDPDDAQLTHMAAALGLVVPPLAPTPPAAPPAAGVASSATGAGVTGTAMGVKLLVAGLVVAGAVAVGAVGSGRFGGPAGGSVSTTPATVSRQTEAPVSAPEVAPRAPAVAPTPTPTTAVAGGNSELPTARSVAVSRSKHRHLVLRGVPARSVPPERTVSTEAAVVAPAVVVAEPVSVAAPAAAIPAVPGARPADAASRLRDEAALVRRAERLLTSDPAAALRLTDERKRRFPGGGLDQEAEVVAIDALLRLGRRTEASLRAHAFEASHAGSLHARRIKRLLPE